MMGKVGRDIQSNFVLSSLQKNGVDTTGIFNNQKKILVQLLSGLIAIVSTHH
jgi:sugar/nucleoside kinase (ribokinase family)